MTNSIDSQPSVSSKEQFLEQLQDVQDRFTEKGIDYRIVGSIGAHALLPPGVIQPLNYDRPGAVLRFQRHPDIDVVVPRQAVAEARRIRDVKVKDGFPVKLGLAASVSEIDFRPDEDLSFLTHKNIAVGISNQLLEPKIGNIDGVPVRTLSAPTLAQTYQTFGGIVRKKDMPQIRALIRTDNNQSDTSAFREFRNQRRQSSAHEVWIGRGLEAFNESAPPVFKNALAAAAILAADMAGKR